MTLIKSISGIRGTIGGKPGEGLSPLDVVKFTSAYAAFIGKNLPAGTQVSKGKKLRIVVGRDARISGDMVNNLVLGTLQGMGVDIIDIGLSTTPTVEIAVAEEKADGGIILTASHNPKQWNALKLLNEKGEFISEKDGAEVLEIAEKEFYSYADVNSLGKITKNDKYFKIHIDKIVALSLVDVPAIKAAKFKVVIDCVNSTGGIVLPQLLTALGVDNVVELYCDPTGEFPHNPEPLPENLRDISKAVIKEKAHVGIVVDPDVDRLALVCEDGEMFGEEYTLVAVAEYVLNKRSPSEKAGNKKGNTVSNLSSTRALRDVTEKHGGQYSASAVGEVNVVKMMKEVKAIIGGEGNGGIILPELHYGRDALVGIALFLSHLAKYGKTCSMLRSTYPNYHISKNKIELTPEIDVDRILIDIEEKYKKQPINKVDGVKIEFDKEWVHLRRSNTEPIIRIYSESESETTADNLAKKIMADIRELIKMQQIAV
ncbi:MAG: phosphoglucosamine mutase [Bacteroidota bacterium]|nr:phosphoglucosamine mutase [Bacteroidota bacterium]